MNLSQLVIIQILFKYVYINWLLWLQTYWHGTKYNFKDNIQSTFHSSINFEIDPNSSKLSEAWQIGFYCFLPPEDDQSVWEKGRKPPTYPHKFCNIKCCYTSGKEPLDSICDSEPQIWPHSQPAVKIILLNKSGFQCSFLFYSSHSHMSCNCPYL